MDKRLLLFLLIAFAALTLNAYLVNLLRPPARPPEVAQGDDPAKPVDVEGAAEDVADKPADPGPPAEEEPEPPAADAPTAEVPEQWIALGSAAGDSPYKMLVLLSNVGASVDQVELNDGTHDLEVEDQSGYLGTLALTEVEGGLKINVVGPGTPADKAGLRVGDVLTQFDGQLLATLKVFFEALTKTKVGVDVAIAFKRDGQEQATTQAVLTERPLKVLRRELNTLEEFDPASFLLTLRQIGDRSLRSDEVELTDVDLLGGRWQVRNATPSSVEFYMPLPASGLEVVKRYRLATAGDEADIGTPLYHLDLTVEIRNTRSKPVDVAYQIDGPNGLPTEGWWYANKQSREWFSSVGVRDVALKIASDPDLLSCTAIAEKPDTINVNDQLKYVGVDAQYFAAVMLPRVPEGEQLWLSDGRTTRAGPVPADKSLKKLTNVSFRLSSKVATLDKKGSRLSHTYRVFLGPKKPDVVAAYDLDDLVYYGMFTPVSKFLLGVMHFCYHNLVFNYGLAIIMLTVMVRGVMFPLSRKQAISAQKMQEIQPELKKLNEKFKAEPDKRQKATMELFRKNKYNPYGGCLLMFIQLPIFIGLYRALMIDVELRQAPLIPGMEWCSNLAAPDMLHRWTWQPFLSGYTSMLGPYFNLLPLFTVALFLWQQKLFMPPPTDEQSAMQQKMMKYMMIFVSLMFFKVPSGLCIYFIASSLWGIAERKLLPKITPATAGGQTITVTPVRDTNGVNGSGGTRRKKQKGKG